MFFSCSAKNECGLEISDKRPKKQDSKSFWSPWPRDMYVRISMSICETMLISLRHLEMIWEVLIFFEILWDALRRFETLWDAMRRFETLRDALRLFETLWDNLIRFKIFWDLWDSLRHFEMLWDALRHWETLWDAERFFETLRLFVLFWNNHDENMKIMMKSFNTIFTWNFHAEKMKSHLVFLSWMLQWTLVMRQWDEKKLLWPRSKRSRGQKNGKC